MYKHHLIACIMVLLMEMTVTAQTTEEVLTLEKFLLDVEHNAEEVLLAGQDYKMSEAYYQEALSAALPSLSVSAGYRYNHWKQKMFLQLPDFENAQIDPMSGDITVPEVTRSYDASKSHETEVSVNLRQNILNLQAFHGIEGAKAYISMSREQFLEIKEQVLSESEKLYYQCVFLQIVYDFDTLEKQAAEENYEIAKSKHNLGLMSDFDFFQSELRYRRSIAVTLNSKNQWRHGLDNLKRVAGLEPDTEVSLDTEVLSANIDAESELICYSMSEVMSRRHDFLAMAQNRHYLQQRLKMEQAAAFPYVAAEINYSFINQWNNFSNRDDPLHPLSLGVVVQWDLLSGGLRLAKEKQAQIEAEKARIITEKMVNDTRVLLENISNSLIQQIRQIEVAKETLEISKRALSLGEINAESGLISQQELKNAVIEHRQVQLNYWQKIYEFHQLKIDWKTNKGEYHEN